MLAGGLTTLANSQCTIPTRAYYGGGGYSPDGYTYYLTAVNIIFSPSFTGVKKIYGKITASNGTVLTPWTFTGYLTIGVADVIISSSPPGNSTQEKTGPTYPLPPTNPGNGPTSGTVTVTDTLPAGLTATAIAGSGWTCTLSTRSCTRSDSLAA